MDYEPMEIKKVEYDEIKCFSNEDGAVCPYCGHKNYIEPEDYKGQNEETFEECGDCGKMFVYTTNYRVFFTSEPYENWALYEIGMYEKRIKYCEALNNGYSQNGIEYYTEKLIKIKKNLEMHIGIQNT